MNKLIIFFTSFFFFFSCDSNNPAMEDPIVYPASYILTDYLTSYLEQLTPGYLSISDTLATAEISYYFESQ